MLTSPLFGVATGPDLLRLLAVPVFGWAAYRDLRTRRVPNRTWLPLLAVGAVALAWDLFALADLSAIERRLVVVRTLLSLGFVAPLGVFSFTILSNAVLAGLLYPIVLAVRNLPRGELTPAMFIGRPVGIGDVPSEYGRLLETPSGFTTRGLDIDAVRMYLRWRGIGFEDLRTDPDRYRSSAPIDPNDPGDGSIDTAADAGRGPVEHEPIEGDRWAAETFLAEHAAYGTTPTELRTGLDVLSEPDRTSVWITPGIPFILPILGGLVVALTFGDVLFWVFSAVGL